MFLCIFFIPFSNPPPPFRLSCPGKSDLWDMIALRYPYIQRIHWDGPGNNELRASTDEEGNTVTVLLNRWLFLNNAPNWSVKTGVRLDIIDFVRKKN